ncbi:MAG: hypothetical protein AB2L20_29970 [Mangrovibacterium sp.]|jgi:hypothetical protein
MRTKFARKMATLLLSVVFFSASAVSADALAANYVIVPVARQDLGLGVEQAWKLSYDENRAPIVVELFNSKKGKTFIVRTDHFEVAYVSSPKGFGARKVRISESKVPDSLTSQVINEEELAKQRILSTEEVDEKAAIELIAAYLPDLVNSSYKHLFSL